MNDWVAAPASEAGWSIKLAGEFAEFVAPLSNWGRWGPDDDLGTLNLLTPQRVLAGHAAVRSGAVVSLTRRIRFGGADEASQALHFMKASGEAAPARGGSHASDWIGIACHGFAVTHIDAHSHQFFDGHMYNGRPASAVTSRAGAASGSVLPWAAGIVGRGVLIDAPRAAGRAWLDPAESLDGADLDRIAVAQGTEVQAGDLVVVRTGRDARAAACGPLNPMRDGSPGLAQAALVWLREHDVALLGSDIASDVMKPDGREHMMPIHTGALVHLGLPLVDNMALDGLAAACAERGTWDFLLVVAPLALSRCTGSPVNPVAVL